MRPIILAGLAMAFALPAAAQQLGDAARGHAYAKGLCAQCHAVEANDAISPAGAPRFDVIANTPGMTAMALGVWLHTTHRKMPNYVFKDENADDVIAYILSLKKPKAPN